MSTLDNNPRSAWIQGRKGGKNTEMISRYTGAHIAAPLEKNHNTLDGRDSDEFKMLRRLALEALGWRIHYEDGLRRSSGHYVFWVGPNNEMNGSWWTEGYYLPDPEYHWRPPLISHEQLLAGFDYEIVQCMMSGLHAFIVSIDTPGLKVSSTMHSFEEALYHAILDTLHPEFNAPPAD